jgi:DNA-binding CsgD family transcriptional regulator
MLSLARPGGGVLIGRTDESVLLKRLLEDARQGVSGVLVIRGEPGIGKSALLEFAVGQAEDMAVLRATGVETETTLRFAGLSELLRPVVSRADRLPEVQRAALLGALAMAPPSDDHRIAVYTAVLGLLGSVADGSGCVCVVDDAHWLDASSAEALTFVGRRLKTEGVLLLMAGRNEDRHVLTAGDLPEMLLAPLDPPSALDLITHEDPDLSPTVAASIASFSHGSPLGLVELPRALSPEERTGLAPFPDPPPATDPILDAFRPRIRSLPADTQQALLVAAASRTNDLCRLAAALRRLGLAVSDLTAADQDQLLLSSEKFAFRHPLLRSVVYHGADLESRRRVHRALADGSARAGDVHQKAWHLFMAALGPDERAASALEVSASEFVQTGGHADASLAFERAAALTLRPGPRARRLLSAAEAAFSGGRPDSAVRLLDIAGGYQSDPKLVADIRRMRGVVEMWTGQPGLARQILSEAAREVAQFDLNRATAMQADATGACFMAGAVNDALESALCCVAYARGSEETSAVWAEAVLKMALLPSASAPADAGPRLRQAWHKLRGSDQPHSYLLSHLAYCLICTEEFETADRASLDIIDDARGKGGLSRLPFALAIRAEHEYRIGRLADAHASATGALDLATELGEVYESPFSLAVIARIEGASGRQDEARRHAERAIGLARQRGFGLVEAHAQAALGFLALAHRDPEGALPPLRRAATLSDELEMREPGALMWAPDLIEALLRVHHPKDAAATLAQFRSDAYRTNRGWAKAAAERCSGLLAEDDEFVGFFDAALHLHAAVSMPLEEARTQLCYGERLRRVGQRVRARRHLRDALETFERIGATPWAEQAREELAATGERVSRRADLRSTELTPQERQVSLLVAKGATNKEVATSLFLSPKTIEYHLHNIYRKLGVRSRTELAHSLTEAGSTP